MKNSIGIDVSMKSLDVVLYDGKTYRSNRYDNNEKGFFKIEKELLTNKKSDYLVTMEATGIYHLKAAIYFQEKGYTVSVVNPLIIKRYSEMKMLRAKTDSVDARLISEYGFNEKPSIYIRKDKGKEHIIQLLRQIEGFQKMLSENRSRLHALENIPDADQTALKLYRTLREDIKAKVQEAERAIQKILNNSYSKEYQRLKTIPGVGQKISSIVIAFFGEFESFENAKQVSSFIGLNPSPRQSGISLNRKSIISKKGNCYMRKMFYMASLSASGYNKSCAELYERCLARGKSKRVALVAVANKLIRQIFAIMKYDRVYDENYCISTRST